MENDNGKMKCINSLNENFRRDFLFDDVAENREDTTLIFLDEKMDDANNLIALLNKFRQLNDCILLYTKAHLCLEYILRIVHEKIILILSKYCYTSEFLNDVHALDTVDSIFVYTPDDNSCTIDFKLYSRKIEFFNDDISLLKSVKTRISLISKQIKFDSFDNNYLKSMRNLKTKPASFLWFHLLIDILNELPKSNEAKQQMIDICQNYYQTNNAQLNRIKEFENTYQSSDAIRWYTKSNFLHKLVNKALRTEDVFLLYLFRYYIIDLCQQIKDESNKYLASLAKDEIIKLYRGQIISEKDLKILEKSVGNFISPNGFFSTSEDRQVALQFAGDDESNGILLEIRIDESGLKQTPMLRVASIQHVSVFPEEKEVLFGIGTTFKIENIVYDLTIKKQCVQMIATDQDFQYIQQYIQLARRKLEETNPTSLYGELIINIGLYSKAELYFKSIIETLPEDHIDLPELYHDLGYVYYKKGRYDEALHYGMIAHNILKIKLKPYDMHIAQSSLNLGWDYKKNGEPHLAMEYFKETLRICQTNFFNQNHYITAMTLVSIGDTYTDLDNYPFALTHLNEGFRMFKRIVPHRHTEIANTLMKFGNLFEKQSLFKRAIKYYHSGYKLAQIMMTDEHPRLLEYFKCILNIYNKTNNIDQFNQFANENVMHWCQSFGDIHPNVAQLYIIIGDFTYDNAEKLLKYNQALDILEKYLPRDQEAISNCQEKIDAARCLFN